MTIVTIFKLICKKQAFITKFFSSLNRGNDISSQFIRNLDSTKPRKQSKGSLGKLVVIKLLDGYILVFFFNISVAARSLKVSDNLLKQYNNAGSLLYIPLLDYEILIEIFNQSVTIRPITHPSIKVYPVLKLEFNTPDSLIVTILNDKNLTFDTFKSSYVTIKFFNIEDPRTITQRPGQDYLINTIQGDFFFIASESILISIKKADLKRKSIFIIAIN